MEEEKIEVVKICPESELVKYIQVFLGFANFYQRFIQVFTRIAAPFTLMLKIILGISSSTNVKRSIEANDNGLEDGNKIGNLAENRSKFNRSGMRFVTLKVSVTFTCLRKTFIKELILYHFDQKHHIGIETHVYGFAIGGIISKSTFGYMTHTNPDISTFEISQWRKIAFFLTKMILSESRYETQNKEHLAIIKNFKTKDNKFQGCKHEVLIFTNYDNFCRFMDTKRLSAK